jgi:hypothetical protein
MIFSEKVDSGAHPSINAIHVVLSSRTTTGARARGKPGPRARIARAVMLGDTGMLELRMGQLEDLKFKGRDIGLRRRIRGELWRRKLIVAILEKKRG